MLLISYNIGCRSCLKSDGTRHSYGLKNADQNEYRLKPEYEVVNKIENWRADDNHKCAFCGGKNVEAMDVEINDYPLYNYDRLVQDCIKNRNFMLMVNIDKKGSEISIKPGGSSNPLNSFTSQALNTALAYINYCPDSHFISHNVGNCFFNVTGNSSMTLQRFRSGGFTKSELINAIKSYAKQKGII